MQKEITAAEARGYDRALGDVLALIALQHWGPHQTLPVIEIKHSIELLRAKHAEETKDDTDAHDTY